MADSNAEDFYRFSKALKHAGRTDLRKELNKRMRAAVKPVISKTRAAADRLPEKGGLRKQVKKAPQRVQVRTGERTFGIRLVIPATAKGARGANRGLIRHPVFGDREKWVDQKVRPGWFDEPAEAEAPATRREVEKGLEAVAEQVVRDAGR